MKLYYLYQLDISPAIVAAHSAGSAVQIFASLGHEKLTESNLAELPEYAIKATIKKPDGTRSISLQEKTKLLQTECLIDAFPLDYRLMNFDGGFSERGYKLALNLILMGVPFTHARKVSHELKHERGFSRLIKWIDKHFGIYIFDVKELQQLHGKESAINALYRLQIEKALATKKAINMVCQEFSDRQEKLSKEFKLKIHS